MVDISATAKVKNSTIWRI